MIIERLKLVRCIVDPMAERNYSISPYTYCKGNPIKFIDPTGMLEEVYINGPESDAATKELQKSTSMTLTRDDKSGKISATGEAKTDADKKLSEAINSTSIKVEVTATDKTSTSAGKLFVGGAFMGNTVTKTENGTTVVAKQEVNPSVLGAISDGNGKPGADMRHEVTEAYQGALISQSTGISSPGSNQAGSVWSQAHAVATPQSGNIYQETIDVFKNPTNNNSYVCGANWYVLGANNSKRVVQNFYRFPKLK